MKPSHVPLAVLAAVGVVTVGTSALTASATVPTSVAGEGSGAMSTVTVTDPAYTLSTDLSSSAGDLITSVRFTIADTSVTTVRARLTTSTPWSPNCTATLVVWTCDVTDLPVLSATGLSVVAIA